MDQIVEVVMMKSLSRNNLQPRFHRTPTFHGRPSRRYRGFSCPPSGNRDKTVNSRDTSLTPRKSKRRATEREETDPMLYGSDPLGPDPDDLPKDISRVLLACSSSTGDIDLARKDEIFSGSVSTIAPPPSSLPLPKFSVRPKLSCRAEAAGEIDVGATDNLRRLLRLQ